MTMVVRVLVVVRADGAVVTRRVVDVAESVQVVVVVAGVQVSMQLGLNQCQHAN